LISVSVIVNNNTAEEIMKLVRDTATDFGVRQAIYQWLEDNKDVEDE